MPDETDLNRLLEAADAAEKAGDKEQAAALAAIWAMATKTDKNKGKKK